MKTPNKKYPDNVKVLCGEHPIFVPPVEHDIQIANAPDGHWAVRLMKELTK